MGARIGSKGKRVVAWQDPDKQELIYAERSSYVLGGYYTVKVSRKDGKTIRHGSPLYTGRRLERGNPWMQAWKTEELEAEQRLAREARERKDKAADEFGHAMEPLLAIARQARTGAQRSALVADVIRRLSYPWGER
jgi:hypothetical protein